MSHKAGFVNIIGNPNVGKSTLMNALVGEKLSIITSKAQTTRHRILGIVNGEDFQVVFSDTPGILKTAYRLHESMMGFVKEALKDADVLLYMTDIYEKEVNDEQVLHKIKNTKVPVLLLINKIDQSDQEKVEELVGFWNELVPNANILPVSAKEGANVDKVFNYILKHLPESPPFYPKDQLTDKPERFFVAEIIREKIFLNYKKEVPYSTEVEVEEFKEEEKIIRIRALIYVERDSQKGIIIGKGGAALKKVGTDARKDIEKFFEKQVFLELHVKVKKGWRNKDIDLKRFGYKS